MNLDGGTAAKESKNLSIEEAKNLVNAFLGASVMFAFVGTIIASSEKNEEDSGSTLLIILICMACLQISFGVHSAVTARNTGNGQKAIQAGAMFESVVLLALIATVITSAGIVVLYGTVVLSIILNLLFIPRSSSVDGQ